MKKRSASRILIVFSLFAVAFFTALLVMKDNGMKRTTTSEIQSAQVQRLPNDPKRLANLALTEMFAPNARDGEDYWIESVCSDMTEGGCEYFKTSVAPSIWNAAMEGPAINGDDVSFLYDVATISDGSHLWKMHVTTFIKNADISQDVFINVVFDQTTGQWMLDRILDGSSYQAPQ